MIWVAYLEIAFWVGLLVPFGWLIFRSWFWEGVDYSVWNGLYSCCVWFDSGLLFLILGLTVLCGFACVCLC